VTPEVGLTTQTSAPYNRLAMPVNDPAIVGAIRRQEERLARDPASLAFAQLADLYRKAGRTRDAVALCRDGLARYPHYTTARLILAKALAADEQLAAALVELNAILEVSPKDLQCHLLSAEVHRRLGHIDEAVKHLEQAVELKPEDPTINDHLGDAYWKVGRVLEAQFQWSHARDLKPEPEELTKIEEKLKSGLAEEPSSAADIAKAKRPGGG